MKQKSLFLSIVAAAGLCGLAVPALVRAQSPLDVVNEYLDLVASGNYESATERWLPACRERSGRFGIEYPGVPIRPDATSPMVLKAEKLSSYTTNPVMNVQNMGTDGRFVRMRYTSTSQGDVLQQSYVVVNERGWYWLCYPQDAFASSWKVRESKFFRVHIHPDVASLVSEASFDQIDGFVEAVADTLGLTKADLAELAAKKIEFFYCDRDSTVMEITGQLTKGLLDLASNDIISANFPHHHEVVHLLANIKMKTVPIYTLPLLREGLAVRFGGRWGKGPATLMDLGTFLHRDTLVTLDSMLSQRGFESGSEVDLAYPVAGVVVSFLWDRLGRQKFWTLYQSFSSRQEVITKLRPTDIQASLVAGAGAKDWAAFRRDFDVYAQNRLAKSAVSVAGAAKAGKTLYANGLATVALDGDWISFTVMADSTGAPRASFLMYKTPKFGTARSLLFDEQFQGTVPFEGYRLGVRVDQNEAGVYDYAGNSLVGKFILSINGTEGYFDSTQNVVTVRFRRSLFGKTTPASGDITMVPY
ncbi:MAG: hypothetical protein HY851_10920 [candidate division Zixibacteria bacterium]|nr:hypothetical protein [candidate division Zixibacteria bacterium]